MNSSKATNTLIQHSHKGPVSTCIIKCPSLNGQFPIESATHSFCVGNSHISGMEPLELANMLRLKPENMIHDYCCSVCWNWVKVEYDLLWRTVHVHSSVHQKYIHFCWICLKLQLSWLCSIVLLCLKWKPVQLCSSNLWPHMQNARGKAWRLQWISCNSSTF